MLPKNQLKNYGNFYAPKLQSDCINYLFPSLKKRNRIAVSEKIPDVRLVSISPDVIKSQFSLLERGIPFLHSWPVAIGSIVSKLRSITKPRCQQKYAQLFSGPTFSVRYAVTFCCCVSRRNNNIIDAFVRCNAADGFFSASAYLFLSRTIIVKQDLKTIQ